MAAAIGKQFLRAKLAIFGGCSHFLQTLVKVQSNASITTTTFSQLQAVNSLSSHAASCSSLMIPQCTARPYSSDSGTDKDMYTPPSPYKRPGPRRYGYETKMFTGGLLPRPDTERRLPMPVYKPKESWNKKRAMFGQNDYIDILGDGNIHPVDLIRGPSWLIGFRGNEFQRLIRRWKFQGQKMRWLYPTKFHQMKKRISFLYRKYNHKRGKRN